MIYKLMDEALAELLQVDVATYIDKIEKTTYRRAELIIDALFSEDDKLIEKARRIFNLID